MDKLNLDKLKELSKIYPNNGDLGRFYRSWVNSNGEKDEFCKKYPNDMQLGNTLRNYLNNL